MRIPLFIIGAILIFLAIVWIIKLLWNWLVPELFKGPRIRFKHALGIVILSRLLFGFGFPARLPARYWQFHHQDGYFRNWMDHHRKPDFQPVSPDDKSGNKSNDNN